MKTKELTEKQGITLISLVVTIIVILIIAGVSVVTLTGENGIINKTVSNKEKKEKEDIKTKIDLAVTSALYDGLEDDEIDLNTLNDELVKDSITIVKKEAQNVLPWIVEENGKKFKIKPDGTVIEKVSVKILDKDGVEHLVAEEDVSDWYGKEVSNYTKGGTYRIFYIDFDGDFGDIGTIYLKADSGVNKTLSTTVSNDIEDIELFKIMNPQWDEERGEVATSYWNNNEKAALWLCSKSQWTDYVDRAKADFAIGSPSLEMYLASYTQVSHTEGNYALGSAYADTTTNPAGIVSGYIYLINKTRSTISNSYYWTGENTVDKTGYNNIYCTRDSSLWWLSSPSAEGTDNVCIVNESIVSLSNSEYSNTRRVCPLVSLKSTFTPQISADKKTNT